MPANVRSLVSVVKDNPLQVVVMGAALGFLAYRLANAARRRLPRSLDYSLSGRGGVYDPTNEDSYYLGAPDADDNAIQRLRGWLLRQYRYGAVSRTAGRFTPARLG